MDRAHALAQLLVVCLLAGVLGQALAAMLRLPSILFLLGLGVALGPDVLGVVRPDALGPGLKVIVRLSVAFILFEGAMALHIGEIRKVQRSVRGLVTVGVLVTFALATAAAALIAGLPLRLALLFGALVTVTGPTVIRPLVQRVRIRPELAAVMEGEGILADPIGAILAAVCLEYALSPEASALAQLQEFGIRLGTGLVVGAGVGYIAGAIVKRKAPAIERIKPLVVLGCALGGFEVSEMIRHESGIMAAVAAGLAIKHGVARHDRELREFRDLITTLLLSLLFILLAANLRKDRMLAEGLPGLLTVLAVMFVVRPLNVALSTAGGKLTRREKVFLSWVAPRGIVAASVASLSALLLAETGRPDAHRVESLVFLTVLLTVIFQAGSAQAVAWALGITVKEARAVIIVGANRLGRALAQVYAGAGVKVTLVDRNPAAAEEAVKEGLRCVAGDATDRAVLHLAGLDEADILITVTPSTTVNQTAALVALSERPLSKVWIGLDSSDRESLDPALERAGAGILFGHAVPIARWNERLERGEAVMVQADVDERNAPKGSVGETRFLQDALPLLLTRGGRSEPIHEETRLKPGDRVTFVAPSERTLEIRREMGLPPATA